ncbi:hypothetical protein HMPREF0971_03158 [Segatella oris F0302]|uniref:Uncharacterized protein n=1 Tax=Segatella oris F0302 TaxID=649760 RepID=D1QVW7_9BACT|nr:hypothetical protein HMPREF0971_03158 [Segatella oris F0302]
MLILFMIVYKYSHHACRFELKSFLGLNKCCFWIFCNILTVNKLWNTRRIAR